MIPVNHACNCYTMITNKVIIRVQTHPIDYSTAPSTRTSANDPLSCRPPTGQKLELHRMSVYDSKTNGGTTIIARREKHNGRTIIIAYVFHN